MSTEDHVTRVHRALAAPRRAEILRLLQDAVRPMGIQEMVELTALHPNTVRNHLEQLIQVGLVRQLTEDRTTPGRPRSLFVAANDAAIGDSPEIASPTASRQSGSRQNPAPEDPTLHDAGYRDLTGILAASLAETGSPTAVAVITGQRWLETLASHDWPARPAAATTATNDLVLLLDEMGLTPTLVRGRSAISIRLPIDGGTAPDDVAVLLRVHLGMVRRALERLDSPVEVAAVEATGPSETTEFVIQLGARSNPEHSGRVPLPVVSPPLTPSLHSSAPRRLA